MLKRGVWQVTDSVIAIGIFLVFLSAIIIPVTNMMIDEYRASVVAGQANRINKATNAYIKDNFTLIAGQATATTPYVLGVPQLITGGYLPSGYSSTNIFSATYQTRVFQPSSNKFHSMTFLIGGAPITKSLARKIAIRIGAEGGIINGNFAEGALGGWRENLSSFAGFNPGDGSLVIAGFFNDGNIANDYLYRKALPGHPELNRMNTAIDMAANDINNARNTNTTTLNAATVNATNVNATNSNAQTTRTTGETYTGGWFRNTGDTGWYNEKHGGGFYMSDSTWVRSYADKSIYTGGQIQAGTLRANGRASVGEYLQLDGTANVGWGCSPNGLVGRTSDGVLLSCQLGIWRSLGALDTFNVTSGEQCENLKEARAYCPAGTKLVSGGYRLSRWTSNDSAHNSPDSAFPDVYTNSWIVVTPNNEWRTTCFQAIAICTK